MTKKTKKWTKKMNIEWFSTQMSEIGLENMRQAKRSHLMMIGPSADKNVDLMLKYSIAVSLKRIADIMEEK